MVTRHLLVKGKVQGVFYRATAKETANDLNITGWVKNTGDGDVEIVCQGKDEEVKKFIDWCKIGPRNADVQSIDITEIPSAQFTTFEIIRNR